jgi:hypothetical protein
VDDEVSPIDDATLGDVRAEEAANGRVEATGVRVHTRPDPRSTPRARPSAPTHSSEPSRSAAPTRSGEPSRSAEPSNLARTAERSRLSPAAAAATGPDESAHDLLSAVERLRSQVATLPLTLDVDDVDAARREREGMLSQLDDYLLPRLRRTDAPLLAVIGGSTGAGKSTLTNSIVSREVSRSGVLRPTTRSPVLVHHPYDSGAFMSQRILPRLTRVTSEGPEPVQPIDPNAPRITGLRLVPHDGIAPGMAIIDAPDIDSLVETNRDLAVQLLQAADLWIFVTTAARYADAMPWQMLTQAAERGVAIAVVLDRVPPEALQDLRVHLATRLRDRGLGGAPLFVIPEVTTENGFLPDKVVAPLQQWLRRVAGDDRARRVIADRTRTGVVASLAARAQSLAAAAQTQADGWEQLSDDVEAVFGKARFRLLDSLIDGSLLSGEVLARWHGFLAEGEFAQRLEGAAENPVERLADRLGAAVRQEGEPAQPLDLPVSQAITAAVTSAARAATDQVLSRWRHQKFGVTLVSARGHQVSASDRDGLVERAVRDWRQNVAEQISVATEKAKLARPDEHIAVDAVADVVFVAVLDESSDDDGAERPTAATLGAARRLLGEALGQETIKSLAASARADLIARAAEVFGAERLRLERMLESASELSDRAALIRAAADQVEAVR